MKKIDYVNNINSSNSNVVEEYVKEFINILKQIKYLYLFVYLMG